MDGWGVSTQKDDAIKYEHDEITCETIFGMIFLQQLGHTYAQIILMFWLKPYTRFHL